MRISRSTIRFSLTIQLTIFLLVVLTLFAGLVLQRFQEILYNDTDVLLRSKVQGLEDSINVFWEFYNRTKVNEENFTQAAKDWIDVRNSGSLIAGLIVRIYKPDGTLIASNRKDLDEVTINREILSKLRDQRTIIENTSVKNFIGFDVRMRSLLSYVESRRQDYIIQTALENKKIEEPLGRLQVVVVLLLPVFLVLGALLEFFLIRRALQSFGILMAGLRNTGSSLNLRFQTEAFKEEETRDLAGTFNTMMDRIDESFDQQRRVFEDLSHQMKTPLAVMRGELEIALKKRRTQGEYQGILESSLEEVERMASIVENLLKLARFDAQELVLEVSRFNLNDFLDELLTQMEKLADSRHIVLDLDCPEDLMVEADQFKLEQALLNLLDNAIKYAKPKTIVTVKAYVLDRTVYLTVHDIGAVIPAVELAQVFERFWRSQSTMRERGYGLGLSIVKALLEMHGGQVQVESSEEGGTLFRVQIPQPPVKKI